MANKQTILTVLLVVVLAALGALWYFYWSGRPAEDAGGTGVIAPTAVAQFHRQAVFPESPYPRAEDMFAVIIINETRRELCQYRP